MNGFKELRFGGPTRHPCGFSRRMQQRACAGVAMLAVLTLQVSRPAWADQTPLTLAETQRIAALRSKQLEAADFAVNASKDLAVSARERPDPVAKIGLENL